MKEPVYDGRLFTPELVDVSAVTRIRLVSELRVENHLRLLDLSNADFESAGDLMPVT